MEEVEEARTSAGSHFHDSPVEGPGYRPDHWGDPIRLLAVEADAPGSIHHPAAAGLDLVARKRQRGLVSSRARS